MSQETETSITESVKDFWKFVRGIAGKIEQPPDWKAPFLAGYDVPPRKSIPDVTPTRQSSESCAQQHHC